MRWMKASLTLVVLIIGLALGRAEAVEEWPRPVDSAQADTHRDLVPDELLGTVFDQGPSPSFNLPSHFDSSILSLPFLADTSHVGFSPTLDSLIPTLPFLDQNQPVGVNRLIRGPSAWPTSAVGRLTWLQRFLF